jgi:hypothetical protein
MGSPGGLVEVMAKSGLKYFIMGSNGYRDNMQNGNAPPRTKKRRGAGLRCPRKKSLNLGIEFRFGRSIVKTLQDPHCPNTVLLNFRACRCARNTILPIPKIISLARLQFC